MRVPTTTWSNRSACGSCWPDRLALRWRRLRSEVLTATRESEEALRASDRRKDEFIAMLSHELRKAPRPPARRARDPAHYRRERAVDAGRVHDMMERQLGHLVRARRRPPGDVADRPGCARAAARARDPREHGDHRVEASEPLIRGAGQPPGRRGAPRSHLAQQRSGPTRPEIASNLLNNASPLHGTRRAHLARRRGPPRSRDAVCARHRHRFPPRGGRWVLRPLPPRFAVERYSEVG